MAEPLKTFFNAPLAQALAEEIRAVYADFDAIRFVREATDGLEALELLDRARQFARALAATLPEDYTTAADILVQSLGPELGASEGNGMAPFRYLPHVTFVATHGLRDFDASMVAQHALTRRFSAEFSLRTFVAHDPERATKWLSRWTDDPNEHVRRLVSEGTRPRLPWAARLKLKDPSPIEALLHRLVDDPSAYVRRSVANHVNDIGKDEPERMIRICQRWLDEAGQEKDEEKAEKRRAVVRHALRFAVKKGDPAALALLGAGREANVDVSATFSPEQPRIGGAVDVRVTLRNPTAEAQDLLVDLAVLFVKANGSTGRRVFKLSRVEITAGGTVTLRKQVTLQQLSTRTHFPGWHAVEVQVNGVATGVGGFELLK